MLFFTLQDLYLDHHLQHRHPNHGHDFHPKHADRLSVVRNKAANVVVGQTAVGMGGAASVIKWSP